MQPFREQDLLAAVQRAIERDRERREAQASYLEIHARYAALTPREQGSYGTGRWWNDDKGNCWEAGLEGYHRESSSRQYDEKDGRPFGRGIGALR